MSDLPEEYFLQLASMIKIEQITFFTENSCIRFNFYLFFLLVSNLHKFVSKIWWTAYVIKNRYFKYFSKV